MAEGLRGHCGGILWLLDLIEEHRGAVRYDWRTRLGSSADLIGTAAMPWGEAVDVIRVLRADPSSMIAAALAGWTHPVSREALVLADLFDLTHMLAWGQNGGKGPKPKPYPRPWKQQTPGRQYGKARPLSELQARLRARFGRAPEIV